MSNEAITVNVINSEYSDTPIAYGRKPLTDIEIYAIYNELWRSTEIIAFARALERAHGITD